MQRYVRVEVEGRIFRDGREMTFLLEDLQERGISVIRQAELRKDLCPTKYLCVEECREDALQQPAICFVIV